MSKSRDSHGRFIKNYDNIYNENANSIAPGDFQDDNVMFSEIKERKSILSETLKKISIL